MNKSEATSVLARRSSFERLAGRYRRLRPWHRSAIYLGVYSVIFSFIVVLGFSALWMNGRTFVWSADGVSQHLLGLEYLRGFLREIVHGVLTGNPQIPMFDFSIGIGDSVITGLFSVGYLDVINCLVAFVPKSAVQTFYVGAVIARFFLSGLTFSLFGRYLRARPWAIMLGSFIYIFCGFATYALPRHLFFGIPMVYLPLMILGLDLVLRRKSPFVLILSTFFMAMTGYYFLYMVVMVMALYTIVRLGYLYGWTKWRELVAGIGRTAGCVILGVSMAGFVFLPIVKNFLNSSRTGLPPLDASELLPTPGGVVNQLSFTFAPNLTWFYLGLSGLVLLAVCVLATRKLPDRKRAHIAVFGLVIGVLYLVPAGGLFMNGFGYVSERWTFLAAFFAAALTTYVLPTMITFSSWRYSTACLIGIAIYAVIGIWGVRKLSSVAHRSLAIGILFLLVITALVILLQRADRDNNPGRRPLLIGSLAGVVCLGLVANIALVYSHFGYQYSSAFAKTTTYADRYAATTAVGRAVARADDTFYRIEDGNRSLPNSAMLGRYNSVSSYWSTFNGSYLQGLQELELGTMPMLFRVEGLNGRATLESLSSVKYRIQRSHLPAIPDNYTLDTDIEASSKLGELYRNADALSLGYVYAQSVPTSQWRKLNALDKQEALLQAAVVDSPGTNSSTIDLTFSSSQVPVKVTYDGATMRGNKLKVTKPGGGFTLTFDSAGDAETYIRLVNVHRNGKGLTHFKVIANGVRQPIRFYNDDFQYYYERPAIMVNLGYQRQSTTTATITFDREGTYGLDSIEVWRYPFKAIHEQTAKLRSQQMRNVKTAPNAVTGSVMSAKAGTLVLGVPFDEGWTVSVDGKPAQTFSANGFFMGLHLAPGQHTVTMNYVFPWLVPGIASSLIGASGVLVLFALLRRRRRRGASNATRRRHQG